MQDTESGGKSAGTDWRRVLFVFMCCFYEEYRTKRAYLRVAFFVNIRYFPAYIPRPDVTSGHPFKKGEYI